MNVVKRWLLLPVALVLAAWCGRGLFNGSDVARLEPVELVRVGVEGGMVTVQTDTGASGSGETVAQAFASLHETASGDIFLDTADYLLVTPQAQPLLEELWAYLRPACRVCLEDGAVEAEAAAAFFGAHEPQRSLMEWRAGMQTLPVLRVRKGRMTLEQQ